MMAKREEKNWLEWIVFAVASVLTIGLIAVLLWDSSRSSPEPVRCEVLLESALRQGTGYRIPVKAVNRGGRTAENVLIEVALLRGSETLETATLEILFLPREGSRQGFVEFTMDPGESDRIETRCVGYQTR
jgi:uncharacterized protein (TIGR02588 family)